MKSIFAIILFSTFTITGRAQLTVVIEDSALSKKDLFSRTLFWVAETWKESSQVIDLADQSNGIIIIKGGLYAAPKGLGTRANGKTMTKVTIQIKDGKTKIEFTNTYFRWGGGMLWEYDRKKKSHGKTYDKWHEDVETEVSRMFTSYKKAINRDPSDF